MSSATATANPATLKAAARLLRCLVVTPEKTLIDQEVDFVAMPLFDGEIGILPGRAPLIGRLGFGALRTRVGTVTQEYFVDGGFAQVRDNVVTVLTNRAIPVAQLDARAANEELQAARARPALNAIDQAERSKAIQRAQAQLRLVGAGPAHA
ncbi:MAG: ATP synthase F1 subunit epsilon [Isosphaeraceae bacterium]